IIGDPNSPNPYFVQVTLENNHQIDDSADVTVNPNCTFYLNGYSEVINSLHLSEGAVYTDVSPAAPGQLTIFGGITVSNSFQPSGIAGHLSLAGQIRTMDVDDMSTLQISAAITDGGQKAGILKTGTGTLRLTGASDYTGNTTVNAGVLEVGNALALGATGGSTYVQNGANLALDGVTVTGEHLFLNGAGFPIPFSLLPSGALCANVANATWAGPITLQGDTTFSVATNVTLTL